MEVKLTTTQAADALGVSKNTVIRQVEECLAGRQSIFLPGECWHVGKHRRILLSAIERIRNSRVTELAAEPTPTYDPDQTRNGHGD